MSTAQFTLRDENADIRRYIIRRIIFKVGLTAVWIIAGFIGVLRYMTDPLSVNIADHIPSFIAMSAVYIAMPFIFLKPQEFLINGNWVGTVGRKFMETKLVTSGVTNKRPVQKDVMRVEMIRDSDGKVFNYEFMDRKYFVGQDYYRTGRKIRHYRGLKYPYQQRNPDDTYCVCVVCGNRNKAEDDRCTSCTYTLMK